MRKGIPCNKTHYTDRKDQDKITFHFLTDDGNTPSSCTIRIGDTDPLTGEVITADFLREYYKMDNHQVYRNIENSRARFTGKEKAEREKLKKDFTRDFTEEHGYPPSKDDVRYYLEHKMPENYHKYIDAFSIYGDSLEEFRYTDEDPFGCDQPDYIDALKEYVATLSPRHMDVYTAMDQRASGGADRITFTDVAKKYEVSCNQIKKDREKIERMIIKYIGPKYS